MEEVQKMAKISRFSAWNTFFLIVATLLAAAQWGLLFWKIPPTAETVFLHYNIYFGIDATGVWNQLLWLPGSGTAIIVINIIFMALFPPLHRVIPTIIAVMTVFLEMILLWALALIVSINTL